MPGKTAVESSDAEQEAVVIDIATLSEEDMLDDATLMQLIDQSLQELIEGFR